MRFDTFAEFLEMGGHGLYVWLCYAVGLVVFLILFWGPKIRKKKVIAELYENDHRRNVQSGGGFQIDSLDGE